jgi:hypothetical protein
MTEAQAIASLAVAVTDAGTGIAVCILLAAFVRAMFNH